MGKDQDDGEKCQDDLNDEGNQRMKKDVVQQAETNVRREADLVFGVCYAPNNA